MSAPRDEHEAAYLAESKTADGRRPITLAFFRLALRGIGQSTKGFVDERIAALEARLEALEARPSIKDAGVWQSGQLYQPGDIVSHAGSGWICHVAHVSAGQVSHDCFRLLVKKGRDGRDTPHA